jgi:hypothetical protein
MEMTSGLVSASDEPPSLPSVFHERLNEYLFIMPTLSRLPHDVIQIITDYAHVATLVLAIAS